MRCCVSNDLKFVDQSIGINVVVQSCTMGFEILMQATKTTKMPTRLLQSYGI